MLSMSNVPSVASAATYYAEDNYYSNDESQSQSSWAGKGAELLGLAGAVDTGDFVRILSGEIGEEHLGRVLGKTAEGAVRLEHRPGLDVTLSPPKSVSLLAEVDGRGDVRAAHEAAVDKVLAFMEQHYARARVSEAGTTRYEMTENLIVGRFHHTTSRELDPQTHTHLVIANATMTEGGHWRSLSNELIWKNQQLLGAIYDSGLAANLRKLGYRLETSEKGQWEIAGITRAQIEHFSQRSQAIGERLGRFGLTRETANAAQREDAALRTRDSKKDVDHVALHEEWKERAQAMGVDFAQIEQARLLGANNPTNPGIRDAKADEAVRFAIAHLTERESVVGRVEVVRTALDHAGKDAPWACVEIEQVEAALGSQVAAKTAQDMPLATGEPGITTPQALQREQLMLSMLEGGRGAVAPIMASEGIDAAIEAFEAKMTSEAGPAFRLSGGQADAARVSLGSADRFVGLQGYAGVGKSTLMELVRTAAEEAGYTVRGMAPSAQAAMTLQAESGIVSVTTARFLLDEGRRVMEAAQQARNAAQPKHKDVKIFGAIDLQGKQYRAWAVQVPVAPPKEIAISNDYGSKELWVMDEASLAGQREMTSLMEMANSSGARLLLVGDRLQMNAVEAGKPFELLQRGGIDGAEMADINRQQVDDLKRAVAAAVDRQNRSSLNQLMERVVLVGDREELLSRIASDILIKHPQDRDKALLIVPLNLDRHAINKMVRDGLKERGEIGADQLERTVLIPTGFTDAQKQSAVYYKPDMMVRFGRDYRSLGVERGAYAKVVAIDWKQHAVTLETTEGRRVVWSPEKHGKVEVYEKEERALAKGDEVRFTRNNKEMEVTNGTLGKVVGISQSAVVLDTMKGEVRLQASDMAHAHWDYAYAMTVYSAQGKTTNDTNFLITADSGKAMGERSFYVGITRARSDMTIYTDSIKKTADLIETIQNKSSAVESLEYAAQAGGAQGDDSGGKPGKSQSGGRSAGAEL